MHFGNWKRVLWVALAVAVLGTTPLVLAQTRPAAPADQNDQTSGARIDINTATQAQLETLPGVGPATAKKIIAGRPYNAVDDLANAGVPASTIEKIRPLVKVGPAGQAAGTAGKGVRKGESGIEKGANAAARGVEKGVDAAAKGVQKGAEATGKAAGKVDSKVNGTNPTPPEKGMVWVNTQTGVYHKEGDRWYGKTKHGKFMTESQAIQEGYRAAKGE